MPPTVPRAGTLAHRSGPFELDELEVASGIVLGTEGGRPAPLPAPGLSPRTALEASAREALRRPPCLVAFSGGRDSSAILALAVSIARAEGLQEPVAFTNRFPASAAACEDEWQELVVGELGLADWERRDLDGELTVLGPIARRALQRHGLFWPANAHSLLPAMSAARGGTVLTGLDGDTLLGGWRWGGLAGAAAGRRPVGRGELRSLLAAALPRWARERRIAAGGLPVPWLRPDARRRLARRYGASAASEPRRWRARVGWYASQRYLALLERTLGAFSAETGAAVVQPLLDRGFLAALARVRAGAHLHERGAALRYLFGDLLPEALLARTSKAEFTDAYWGAEPRQLAAGWSGEGLDPKLVDAEALRRAWLAEDPPFSSATPLQAAWLASRG